MELEQEALSNIDKAKRTLIATKRMALRAVQVDEHLLDLSSAIHLQFNDELIPLRLGRISVLVAIDVDTTCILGYWVSLSRAPNQDDLLSMIEHCVMPWRPMTIRTPGLQYEPGALFPSAIPETRPIHMGNKIHMDNAWIHSAKTVIQMICGAMGGTIALGRPASPTVRSLIESVFSFVNTHLSHRPASTTGSSVADPIRESSKNSKKIPVITFRTVLEALSIILTKYNVTPRSNIGNATPLDLFSHHLSSNYSIHLPHDIREQWRPFICEEVVSVKWYHHEKRRPFINFSGCRYQGDGLDSVAAKKGKIRIQYDRRKIRELRALTMDGVDLGAIHCPVSWKRFEHSLATRKTLNRLIRQQRLSQADPLAEYFRLLLEKKESPSAALSLLRVYSEFTHDGSSSITIGEKDDNVHAPSTPTKLQWSVSMADHVDSEQERGKK